MTLAGTATHGGGSCQLSLSYDSGATFRVIKSIIGGCPLTSTYDFTVPSYAPTGAALFAWTWQNQEGNREFYMNCAEVTIVSGYSRRQRRQSFTGMDSLPYLWKANLQGINTCTTVEGDDPVYPHPGPDVQYGGGMSSASAATPGDCDEQKPFGQTHKELRDVSPDSVSAQSAEAATTLASPAASLPDTTSVPPLSAQMGALRNSGQDRIAAATSASTPANAPAPFSTTTDLPALSAQLGNAFNPDTASDATTAAASPSTDAGSCPAVVTSTIYPSAATVTITAGPQSSVYTTSAPSSLCTGTSAACPCVQGYACSAISPCTWACESQAQTLASSPTSSRSPAPVVITSTNTVIPVAASPSSATPSSAAAPSSAPSQTATPAQRPPYAAEDLEGYLPCVLGSFICTGNTTWATCDYNDGSVTVTSAASGAAPTSSSASLQVGGWVYEYQRNVSAGIECLPFLSPYSNATAGDGQQSMTPAGYYRDDRVVRARPDGDCAVDGSIQCTSNGTQFDLCDQGGYVEMGDVAAGTTCIDGQIVASP